MTLVFTEQAVAAFCSGAAFTALLFLIVAVLRASAKDNTALLFFLFPGLLPIAIFVVASWLAFGVR